MAPMERASYECSPIEYEVKKVKSLNVPISTIKYKSTTP